MRVLFAALGALCFSATSFAQAAYTPLNAQIQPLAGFDGGFESDVRAPQLALADTVFLTELDPSVLSNARAGDLIGLQLNPDTTVIFSTSKVDGGVWHGELLDAPEITDEAVIAVSETGYFGRFTLRDGSRGEIHGRFDGPGLVFLRDGSRTPPNDPPEGPMVPPTPFNSPFVSDHAHSHGAAASADTPTPALNFTGDARPVTDILYVWTPQVEEARPTVDFDAMFTALTASMNTALDDSGSQLQVRRAGAYQYSYDGPHAGFLGALATGQHPDVDEAREAANADLVAYIGIWDFSEAQFCGVAWIGANSQYAQSLTHVDCVSGYTFEHEVGHNIGMAHDPENANFSLQPYGFGYQNKTEGNRFRTIMAYNCSDGNCPRINQFSTPLTEYNGEATGTAEGNDNARLATERAAIVSSLRDNTATVSVAVTGAGVVRADDGQACSTNCDLALTEGESVTLTAEPDTAAGATFVEWGGNCSGSDLTCVVPLWQAVSVEATFTDTAQRSLIVEVTGDGTVSSDMGGIACPGTCTALYNTGDSVTLTAAAPGVNDTRRWTGDCAGSENSCTVDLSSTQLIQVLYEPILHPVTLVVSGAGGLSNSVNSDVCNYTNAPGCSFEAPQGQTLTLTRTTHPFTGIAGDVVSWDGACGGETETSCSFEVTGPTEVSLDLLRTITAFVDSNGAPGTLESTPAGILNPGGSYYMQANSGDEITLSAISTPGGTGFLNWSNPWENTAYKFQNGCPETEGPDCAFTVADNSRQFVATFGYMVTTEISGNGSVVVTGSPEGYTCMSGESCEAPFVRNSAVELVATPADGWRFGGWSGQCGGQGSTCTLSASDSRYAQAIFLEPNQLFAATAPGARSGVVGGDAITAFVSVVASAGRQVENCVMTVPDGAPVSLTYRATNASNEAIGGDNPIFSVDGSTPSTFVMALTPNETTPAEGYLFHPVIECAAEYAAPVVGVNSLALSIGAEAGPDIISIGATPTSDGVVRINGNPGVEAFTAAATNIGAGDGSGAADEATITVTADTGDAQLPLLLTVCETDPNTGQCLADQADSVETVFTGSDVKFFTAFVYTDGADGVTFDPANARVFLRFTDANGVLRSVTGAAVTSDGAGGDEVAVASSAAGRWAVQISRPSTMWPPQRAGTLYVVGDGRAVLVSGDDVMLAELNADEAGQVGGGLVRAGQTTALAGQVTERSQITLGYAGQGLTGSIWGVYDARSQQAPANVPGVYGFGSGQVTLDTSDALTGTLAGCTLSGSAIGIGAAPGLKAYEVELSDCAQSGLYVGVIDAAQDGHTLVLAGEHASWQLDRMGDLSAPDLGSARP